MKNIGQEEEPIEYAIMRIESLLWNKFRENVPPPSPKPFSFRPAWAVFHREIQQHIMETHEEHQRQDTPRH